MRRYTASINELYNVKNMGFDEVLRHIAKEEDCLKDGQIEYGKLYSKTLRPRLRLLVHRLNLKGDVRISKRQFEHIRLHKKGRVPKDITVYLLGIYELLLSYNRATGIQPVIQDITYCEYTVGLVLGFLIQLLRNNAACMPYTQTEVNEFEDIYNQTLDLDNITSSNKLKLYNNIW